MTRRNKLALAVVLAAVALLARTVEILGTELQRESAVFLLVGQSCANVANTFRQRAEEVEFPHCSRSFPQVRMPQANAPRTIRALIAALNTMEFAVRISPRTIDTHTIRGADDID